MGRQLLNLLQATEHPQTGPVAERRLLPAGLKQLVGGNLQRGGKTQNHVGVHAKPIAFVVGNERLNNPDSFRQFDLRPPSFLSQPRQPLTNGFRFGATRLKLVTGYVFTTYWPSPTILTTDNGDILSHTISRSSGLAGSLIQSFSYTDPTNRLFTASEGSAWS